MDSIQGLQNQISLHFQRIWGAPFSFRKETEASSNLFLPAGSFLIHLSLGQIRVSGPEVSIVALAGDFVMLSSGTPLEISVDSATVSGWGLFFPSSLGIMSSSKHACIVEVSDLIRSLCERVVSWGLNETPPDADVERVALLLSHELPSIREVQSLNIPMPQHPGLRLVSQQILQNPQDMQTLEAWSKVAGISKRSFTRRFAEETGLTFGTWRQKVKLSFALKSIALGNSVAETAHNLGYQTASAFIVVFKKQFGTTPMKYQRKYGK